MKFSKYYSANILSLIGNIGLFIFLLSSIGNISIQSLSWSYIENNCGIWAFIIAIVISLLIIEIFLNTILKNKYILNIQVKNNKIKKAYNILFWIGFVCAILYLMLYSWFVYVLFK